MIEPLVTVIIPAHNRFEWLQQAVISAVDQTYTNLEIIIIDDASNPTVEEKLSPTDPRIKIIRNEKNEGPGKSREIGRLVARGKYINYLDSDDLLHPQKIWKQVEILQQNPSAGMCYCIATIFDELPLNNNLRIWSISEHKFESILPIIIYQRPWPTCACLWTTKATDIIGPWTSLWVGEDIEYETRAGYKGVNIIHLSEPLVYVRRNNSETQLTNLSTERLISATDYLLLNSQGILNSQYKLSGSIRWRIVQILLNQSIFLLTQNEYFKAIKCNNVLQAYLVNFLYMEFLFVVYKFLIFLRLGKLAIQFGRSIRPFILKELMKDNEYAEFLQR